MFLGWPRLPFSCGFHPGKCMADDIADRLPEGAPNPTPLGPSFLDFDSFLFSPLPESVLHRLCPLANGCPRWTSRICWWRAAVYWRLILLLSTFLSHPGGQTSHWRWISTDWSSWISQVIFIKASGSWMQFLPSQIYPDQNHDPWIMLLQRYAKSSTDFIN